MDVTSTNHEVSRDLLGGGGVKRCTTPREGESTSLDVPGPPEWLVDNNPRRTYLITYSKANKLLFPTRESFARKCEEAFGGGKCVSFYACAEEAHVDGSPHYHVRFKLTKPQRWAGAKKVLSAAGAVANFAKPAHKEDGMYAWAYRYIMKFDKDVYHSPGHPCLQEITSGNPNIHKANAAYRKKRSERAATTSAASANAASESKKRKRLSNEEVADYCRLHELKTVNELLADAETRKLEGDTTQSSFFFEAT